jgi:hypothetical protein
MAHDLTYPEALGTLLTRLPELQLVLGPQAKGGLESVQLLLQEAVAARADGDVPKATKCIGTAMDTLSQLASLLLDPHEAMMMRMLAAQFRQALQGGDTGEARRVSGVMREKSGTTIKKKPEETDR